MKTTKLFIITLAVITFAFIACNDKGNDPPTHVHEWEWVVTTAATTEAEGVETETCKTCGAINGTRPIAKLPLCNCDPEEKHYLPCDCGGTDCTCEVSPRGYITEIDTNAQIPIWQTEGVTDAQAQTASGNIATGYGAVPSSEKLWMKNKVKEYRIVDDVNSFDQDGAKRVIYINMNATSLEIRNYLRDYVAPELGLIPNE
ncbi:hypothetical protein [Treponema sp. R6D11]